MKLNKHNKDSQQNSNYKYIVMSDNLWFTITDTNLTVTTCSCRTSLGISDYKYRVTSHNLWLTTQIQQSHPPSPHEHNNLFYKSRQKIGAIFSHGPTNMLLETNNYLSNQYVTFEAQSYTQSLHDKFCANNPELSFFLLFFKQIILACKLYFYRPNGIFTDLGCQAFDQPWRLRTLIFEKCYFECTVTGISIRAGTRRYVAASNE